MGEKLSESLIGQNELKLNATEDETLRIKVNPIAWQEIPKIWNNLL